jgi:hypothetical protein
MDVTAVEVTTAFRQIGQAAAVLAARDRGDTAEADRLAAADPAGVLAGMTLLCEQWGPAAHGDGRYPGMLVGFQLAAAVDDAMAPALLDPAGGAGQ